MSANGISTLPTKEDRQLAKLNLAQIKRKADGDTEATAYRPLNTANVSLLPTHYVGNDVVDNDAPLQLGRPWV
jgi:hypothetical protein